MKSIMKAAPSSCMPPCAAGSASGKKYDDRHLQRVGHRLQPAGADAVRALLVFLDLLKRDAELVAELLLAQAEHLPAHAHPAADIDVRRIGALGPSLWTVDHSVLTNPLSM